MDGHAGKDLLVKVPCGTLVWQLSANPGPPTGDQPLPALPLALKKRPRIRYQGSERAEEIDLDQSDTPAPQAETERRLVADLTTHGEQFILCQGGRGGLGNKNFATARRQTPRFAQPGEPGTEGEYKLELRLIADVGLVGYPNAGKSTLLSAISHARPKIAPYPFTTLHPQIGIVEFPDFYRLTVCDVPGLIEGAHRNVGLGHAFLRHIQRCKVLILLLDLAGTDGRHPWDDYQQLLKELELYDAALLRKPRLVVGNKIDELSARENLTKFKRKVPRTPVVPISAAFDVGVAKFKETIRKAVEKAHSADEAKPDHD